MADNDTSSLPESTIYSTLDYEKFKYIDGNRIVSKAHLRTLISSFNNHPDLARSRPILVNSSFEIIDGQHRFEASRALSLPVYYTISNNIDISTARLLNAAQRGWNLRQYLDSYVATGHQQYIHFSEMLEEFPIPMTMLMIYMAGYQGHNLRRQFKEGTFKMMKDKELVRDRLEKLKDFSQYYEFWSDDGLCIAFFKVLKMEGYDHDRMLRKMKEANMQRQVNQRDYLRELERVYNWHITNDKNYLWFR